MNVIRLTLTAHSIHYVSSSRQDSVHVQSTPGQTGQASQKELKTIGQGGQTCPVFNWADRTTLRERVKNNRTGWTDMFSFLLGRQDKPNRKS